MMDAKEWQEYYNLKQHNPKLAREYRYLLRRRATIQRLQQNWFGRVAAFQEEIKVESFKIDLEEWGQNEDE